MEWVMLAGLVRKWKSEIFPKIDYALDKKRGQDDDEFSISLTYFQSSLYTLGLGCVISAVCFFIECICIKLMQKYFHQRPPRYIT